MYSSPSFIKSGGEAQVTDAVLKFLTWCSELTNSSPQTNNLSQRKQGCSCDTHTHRAHLSLYFSVLGQSLLHSLSVSLLQLTGRSIASLPLSACSVQKYVREQILLAVAVIVKRGSLDKSINCKSIFHEVGQLISSGNPTVVRDLGFKSKCIFYS